MKVLIAISIIIIIIMIWMLFPARSEGFAALLRPDFSISIPVDQIGPYAYYLDRFSSTYALLETPPGKLTKKTLDFNLLQSLRLAIDESMWKTKKWLGEYVRNIERNHYYIITKKNLPVDKFSRNESQVMNPPYYAFTYNGPMAYSAVMLLSGKYKKIFDQIRLLLGDAFKKGTFKEAEISYYFNRNVLADESIIRSHQPFP